MAEKIKKETIHAKGYDIGIYTYDFKNEYVSLTDIAKYRSIDPRVTIHNWLRGRDIVEFLGLWESLQSLATETQLMELILLAENLTV